MYVDNVFSTQEREMLKKLYDSLFFEGCNKYRISRGGPKISSFNLNTYLEIINFNPPFGGGCETSFQTAFQKFVRGGQREVLEDLAFRRSRSHITGSCRPMRYNLEMGVTHRGDGWHHDSYEDKRKLLSMVILLNSGEDKWEGGNLELGYRLKGNLDAKKPTSLAVYTENRGVIFNDVGTVHRVTPIRPIERSSRDILALWLDYS